MIPKLIEIRYLSDYRVWLRFADAVQGEVDLAHGLWGEVFAPLRNKSEFAKVRLHEQLGTLVWPNGADFAPEFLYQKLRPTTWSSRPGEAA